MSRTRRRLAVLLLLCVLSIGAAVTMRQWLRKWTEAAQLGLSPAEVEDRRELAELWRKPAVKPVSTIQQVYHFAGIGAMAFSHDGKHLATAGRWNSLSIWNTADWTLARSIDLQGTALCLAFSPPMTGSFTPAGATIETPCIAASTGKRESSTSPTQATIGE